MAASSLALSQPSVENGSVNPTVASTTISAGLTPNPVVVLFNVAILGPDRGEVRYSLAGIPLRLIFPTFFTGVEPGATAATNRIPDQFTGNCTRLSQPG